MLWLRQRSAVSTTYRFNDKTFPCLGRDPGPVLSVVAEAKERCIDKIEHVEETEYDDVVSRSSFFLIHGAKYRAESIRSSRRCDIYKRRCVIFQVESMFFKKVCKHYGQDILRTIYSMDQITIKTPHPKCRLYWSLIELTD